MQVNKNLIKHAIFCSKHAYNSLNMVKVKQYEVLKIFILVEINFTKCIVWFRQIFQD